MNDLNLAIAVTAKIPITATVMMELTITIFCFLGIQTLFIDIIYIK